jgi:hypothetical protein
VVEVTPASVGLACSMFRHTRATTGVSHPPASRRRWSQKGALVTEGIKTFIYPVTDLARAKALYSKLLGVEPYMDEAYYVGFSVAGQDIGLDPHGHSQGMTGPGDRLWRGARPWRPFYSR